jgi:hypothetical protein
MTGPPQLWQYLTTHYLPLPPALAWQWWRAIVRARWGTAVAWRDAFLTLSRTNAALTPNLVPDYLGELATLGRLVELVEALMQEKTLLRHDGRAIEEALFAWADQHGQWIRERRRKAYDR